MELSSAVDEKEFLFLIEGAVTETNGRKEIISVEDFDEECVEITRCVKRKVGADEESAIIVSDDEEEASSSLSKGKIVHNLEEQDVVPLYEIINIRDDRDKITAYMQGLGRPCDGQPAFYRRGKPDWSTLPSELLVYMFQFVHPRILIERLSKVCFFIIPPPKKKTKRFSDFDGMHFNGIRHLCPMPLSACWLQVCDRWRGVVRYIVHCKATNYF